MYLRDRDTLSAKARGLRMRKCFRVQGLRAMQCSSEAAAGVVDYHCC